MLSAVAILLLYYLASLAAAALLLEWPLLALRRRYGATVWYALGSALARTSAYAPAMIGAGHGGMALALPVAARISLASRLDAGVASSGRVELLASWIPVAMLACLTTTLSLRAWRRRGREAASSA